MSELRSKAGSLAMGAAALGAVALGAVALGALAVGAVAIGRLRVLEGIVKDLRIERLEIGELVVRSRKGDPLG